MFPTPYPEIILLLALTCPATIAGVLYYSGPQQRQNWHWLGLLAVEGSLLVCAALLFPQSLVWRWPSPLSLLVIPLLLPVNIALEACYLFGPRPHRWRFLATNTPHVFAVLAGVALVGAFEETLYRGVLLSLLQHRLGSPLWLAALVGNLMFAAMHCYQGWKTMGAKFISGTVYTLVFLSTSSLLPAILLHSGQNVIVILLGRRQSKGNS